MYTVNFQYFAAFLLLESATAGVCYALNCYIQSSRGTFLELGKNN